MKWIALVLLCGGCGTLIEPGHVGLYFNSRHGGLQRAPLAAGYYYRGARDKIIDFDVTCSTRKERIATVSAEGLTLNLRVDIIFRPIVSELYDLDVEVGEKYYDEVMGPEFRTATRGVFARHSYLEVQKNNEKLEDEVEAEVRRRIAGKHIEVSSVTIEEVSYAPELAEAIRQKLVGVEEAARKRTAMQDNANLQQSQLEIAGRLAKQTADAAMFAKEEERKRAEQQIAIDKLKAANDAANRIASAKAEAEAIHVLAKAHAEEARAQAAGLTPLSVMVKAYDALANLGGDNTHIMLGDWSKVPSFLFPQIAGLRLDGGKKR